MSLTTPRGPVTVRYDSCAAMTTRPDGARSLTGRDGFCVSIEPTLYRGVTPERIATVDAAVPPTAVVRMPARDPEQIPQPRKRQTSNDAGGSTRSTWAWTLALWTVGLLAAIWGLLCAVITADESGAANLEWDAVIGVWVLELPLLLVTWKLYRARQRRRG